MEINTGGKWSLSEAMSAVQAKLFLKMTEADSLPQASMSFTEIRDTLTKGGKKIGSKMLSKTLRALQTKGILNKDGERKGIRYFFKKPSRDEKIAVYAAADRAGIEAAASFGGVGNVQQGWTFYGVPDSLAHRIRPRLRMEASRFQERIDRILKDEADRFLRSLVRRVRGRLSAKDLQAGERALWHAINAARAYGMLSAGMAWVATFLDRTVPGTMGRAMSEIVSKAPTEDVAAIRFLAWRLGTTEERVKKEFDAEAKRQAAGRRLFEALPPRERDRAGREFAALVQLSASLCAVVR